jgi:PTH1 family peptidyl-tRNA hydrolase
MGTPIELIVGLGNPDPEYLPTRHNAGFWFADLLAGACNAVFRRDRKLRGEMCDVAIAGQRIRLLKPLTFMNLSGQAVAATVTYYRIAPSRMLVAYDELDLPPGRAKLKFGGGDAGHNGLRSVIENVGGEFWRLRLGIGHPGPGRREEVLRYVLARPGPEDEKLILNAARAAIETLPVLLDHGEERAKTRLHSHAGTAGQPQDES